MRVLPSYTFMIQNTLRMKQNNILPHVESVAPDTTPVFLRISTLESFKMQANLLTEKNEQPFNFWHCSLQAE